MWCLSICVLHQFRFLKKPDKGNRFPGAEAFQLHSAGPGNQTQAFTTGQSLSIHASYSLKMNKSTYFFFNSLKLRLLKNLNLPIWLTLCFYCLKLDPLKDKKAWGWQNPASVSLKVPRREGKREESLLPSPPDRDRVPQPWMEDLLQASPRGLSTMFMIDKGTKAVH